MYRSYRWSYVHGSQVIGIYIFFSGVQERSHEVGPISMNIDTPESCMSSRVCNIKDSATNQQNEVLVVAQSRKRLRLSAWRRSRKRMRLSSQNTCDENCSLSDEKVIYLPVFI